MNSIEFEEYVKAAQELNPLWFDLSIENESVSVMDISNFERTYQISLPEKYKSHILKHGAGCFAFANLYSPAKDSEFSIGENKEQYPLPISFFPISDNGCGDYYGFISSSGVCSDSVYWLGHEDNYKNPIEQYHCLYEFLVRIGLNQ
jgi:hypothetical protein